MTIDQTRGRVNFPDDPGQDRTVPDTLAGFAAVAVEKLGDKFPAETLLEQQVMCVAEEAGEFLAVYRRWRGLARRTGSWEEVCAELADVLLAAHVTLNLLRSSIPDDAAQRVRTALRFVGEQQYGDPSAVVRQVYRSAAKVTDAFDRAPDRSDLLNGALIGVAVEAHRAADLLGIDLETAWRAKAETILTRSWREERAS